MPLPPPLKKGAVVYMRHRSVLSTKPHFCILLNCHDDPDSVILLSVITSQVEKRKQRNTAIGEDPRVIVDISPNDYPELTVDSAVDCSSIIKTSRATLEIDAKTAKRKTDIPKSVLEKIIVGVLVCKTVPEAYKKLLRS